MLKIFKSSKKAYYGFRKVSVQKRFFLSEAYRCEEAWKARLQSPLLQKFEPENLYMRLNQIYATGAKVSAVDIDIFANSVTEKYQVEELLSLLQNMRKSAEATSTLDSTHHAVIRYLLDNKCTEELMKVLSNRLVYGIFPDHVDCNILMDTYIKEEDYASAAKIGTLSMLQEDSEHPITNALSIYACHKYLENPDTWQKPLEPVDDSTEEILIRVEYLRNPYFDDHFDLNDPRDLVGKTLAFHGRAMNNTLGRTCQLRGLILYKKYEKLSRLIEQWLKEVKGNVIYDEVFHLIEKDKKNIPEKEGSNEFENLMSEVNKLKQKDLCKDSLVEALESNVKSAVEKQHDIDINKQLQKYNKWEKNRQIALDKQQEYQNHATKLQDIVKLKEYLKKRERHLTFFENEEDIELQIEKIEQEEADEMKRVLSLPRARQKLKKLEEEEEYIPPRI